MKVKDEGPEEYNISQLFIVGQLPLSPRTHGKPHISLTSPIAATTCTLDEFTPGRSQEHETIDEDLAGWIYTDPFDKGKQQIKIPTKRYGKGFTMMQNMGYDGHSTEDPRNKVYKSHCKPFYNHKIKQDLDSTLVWEALLSSGLQANKSRQLLNSSLPEEG